MIIDGYDLSVCNSNAHVGLEPTFSALVSRTSNVIRNTVEFQFTNVTLGDPTATLIILYYKGRLCYFEYAGLMHKGLMTHRSFRTSGDGYDTTVVVPIDQNRDHKPSGSLAL